MTASRPVECRHFDDILLNSTAAFLAAAMFLGDRMTASTWLAGVAAVCAGSLVLSSVLQEDEKMYKCEAYNYVVRQSTGGSYHRLVVRQGTVHHQ